MPVTSPSHARPRLGHLSGRLAIASLNLLATIQFVWFYVNRVPPHIKLLAYEQGLERTPFQYRLLMMYPMRWAHHSLLLGGIARSLSSLPGWFPRGVRPEGIVQAAIDLICVAIAGLVARKLYQASSPSGLLTPLVYPLTLLMAVTSYCLLTMHLLRFIYDLPSLAFFSIGLYLIYLRHHPLWFALLFVIATLNRETTLFLLLFFVIAQCIEISAGSKPGNTPVSQFNWRRLFHPSTISLILALSLFWIGWHLYVVRLYAANPGETISRVSLNTALLLFPITWPQIFATFCYLGPFVLVCRKDIPDPLLRAWLWVVPAWFAFMLYFGVVIETRIFGELIPYFACSAALIGEQKLLARINAPQSFVPRRKINRSGGAPAPNKAEATQLFLSTK